jgi:hypothetical protein
MAAGVTTMTAMPTAAEFRERLDSVFLIDQAGVQVPLRLASVSDARTVGGFVFWSVFFHGPSDRLLPQGIYTLGHETLGALDLFIVPVLGSNRERIVYEAAFSRAVAGQP